MPKVTVIIPVYGVEAHIERCARSLFEQTLDDLEYIFVNDCTKDKSIEILKRVLEDYPNRKDSVKIIDNSRNLGLPRTRLAGLKAATGNYVAHCDSDDWVDTSLYESMYSKAIADDADFVVCDFVVVRNGTEFLKRGIHSTDKRKYIINLLNQVDTITVWNKLLKKDLYSNMTRYPVENMGEDLATTLQIVPYCKKVSYSPEGHYYYNGDTVSISREETKTAVIKRASGACANASLILSHYECMPDKMIHHALIHLKFNQRKLFMPAINHKDVFILWKQAFPEINLQVIFNPFLKISIIDRLKFVLTLLGIFPWFKQHFRSTLL